MKPGDRITLAVEKPAAGGRMIARHDAGIVLLSAGVPGERVDAEVEKVQRGTVWARTTRVLTASPDRVTPSGDWTCGGNVFAHIAYPRQLTIKSEIIRDAFTRIGRLTTPEDLAVAGSRSDGYRMRARLHVRRGRIGFFREGTHELCPAGPTGQLLPATVDAMERLARSLAALGTAAVAEVEVSENCAADQRAVHLELADGGQPSRLRGLSPVEGVTGASCGTAGSHRALTLWGIPAVTDALVIPAAAGDRTVTLTRHAHAFFQGNRFLIARLAAAVVDAIAEGPVLDLYAGVGLFSAALSVGGISVTAIEGDRVAAEDLKTNAAAAGGGIEARHQAVETFLTVEAPADIACVIVDPPRTGMTKEALRGALLLRAARIVYVSCDVATLARDARAIADSGYRLSTLQGFDLFPNTAHVETVAVFDRSA